jgi:hypothetical protein
MEILLDRMYRPCARRPRGVVDLAEVTSSVLVMAFRMLDEKFGPLPPYIASSLWSLLAATSGKDFLVFINHLLIFGSPTPAGISSCLTGG